MDQFFGSIYSLFNGMFGLDLADYLWGQASPLMTNNLFISFGLAMFTVSAVLMVVFYYVHNPVKYCVVWWLVYGGINALINFLWGWQMTLKDYYDGLMVNIDAKTQQQVPLNIYPGDCVLFGVANMILSIIVFVIFSFLFKWWSRNNSHTPF